MSEEERGARTANIFDVARLAGVSHQTVSRVLNDTPGVRPATRQRVEQAISQLRYSPSPAARALVTRRTRTVGLITPANADYGPTSVALHFNLAARSARYSVDAVSSPVADPAAIRSTIEALLRQRVEAIVLITADSSVLEFVRSFDSGVPLVAVDAMARRDPLVVSIDQVRGARSAVSHLLELGHTRILHLAGPQSHPDGAERARGWRTELAAAGIAAPEPAVGDWSAASGHAFALTHPELVPGSAVFAANDQMALGIISGLRARGLRVPEDVSVVGFDDLPDAAYYSPPLTTVRQDFVALGGLIMQKVLIAIEEPDALTETTPLPTSLIVRESTATAR